MSNQQRAILNFVLIVSGAALVGLLLGYLSKLLAIWLINTFGAGYLAIAAQVTAASLILVPTWFGWRTFAKRHQQLTFADLFEKAKPVNS